MKLGTIIDPETGKIEDLYWVCEDENGELVRVPVSVVEK